MDATRLVAVIVCCWLLKRIEGFTPRHNEDFTKWSPLGNDAVTTDLKLMSRQIQEIPPGKVTVTAANLAYNRIEELPFCVFFRNSYYYLETLNLAHNRISSVDPDAFKYLPHLKEVDLSYNNITFLDPHSFKYSRRLEKVDVAFNNVRFDLEKPFLRSKSLKSLILSSNNITYVFDITFAKLPSLEILLLNDNNLNSLSRRCFAQLGHLQYLSLAGSQVMELGSDMFHNNLPRRVQLTGTGLAQKFTVPLKMITARQLVILMKTEEQTFEGDNNYREAGD